MLAGLVPALGAQMAYMTPGSNPIVSLGAVLKNDNQKRRDDAGRRLQAIVGLILYPSERALSWCLSTVVFRF